MLLAFMEEQSVDERPRLDDAVAEFLAKLPSGDDTAGCLYLWFAFEHSYDGRVSEYDFADACRRLGRTITVHGREYVTGVDAKATRQWFRDQFDH